ncbi:hypothetical protein H6G17_21560 [Chroococcidiopsis sp. FACHB-1243]|uniref:hypothetical protein n=1 Tax=Chroococcidiopsis sp. [FACHB-1243] TaxID=2692781 RepID=UPI00177B1D38|nr:hypothetical protein [Chroococcidiopsis sp. [FACHB-1243]]MBD2308063.1 hypothetical protein [Chroococcidiopsis sp. [FACHB-1243]]
MTPADRKGGFSQQDRNRPSSAKTCPITPSQGQILIHNSSRHAIATRVKHHPKDCRGGFSKYVNNRNRKFSAKTRPARRAIAITGRV